MTSPNDNWAAAHAYDRFMGRWSREIAGQFLAWLQPPRRASWLEIGCGTGALTDVILLETDPVSILATDSSQALISIARERIRDERVRFERAEAKSIASGPRRFQMAVSGLVLNFVENPHILIRQLLGQVTEGGAIAAYVWDYSKGMEFLRVFWDAAVALDRSATDLDEGRRFPICAPGPLRDLFTACGLKDVDTVALRAETVFSSFADYWEPFLGGIGPAPSYVGRLSDVDRAKLEELLRERLVPGSDGSIRLTAAAWAVRGYA